MLSSSIQGKIKLIKYHSKKYLSVCLILFDGWLPRPINTQIQSFESWLFKRVNTQKQFYTLIFIITLLAFSLRIHKLAEASLWYDEILTSRAAEAFLVGEGFTEPGGTTYARSWLSTTLPISLSFAIFGVNEFAARFPSALVGTFLIPVGYIIGTQVINRYSGILFSLILASDLWLLTWSQEARMYIHVILLYTLFLYLFYDWYDDGMPIVDVKTGLIAIIGVFGYNTHSTFKFVGVVTLAFLSLNLIYLFVFAPISKICLDDIKITKIKNIIFVSIMLACAAIYLYVEGIPRELTGYAPQWYLNEFGSTGRPKSFYWDLIARRSPFPEGTAGVLFVSGIIYMLTRKTVGIYYIIGFLLPFTMMSSVLFQEGRYILFLYPVFLLICISPIGGIIDYSLKTYYSDNQSNFPNKRVGTVIIIVLLIISQAIMPIWVSFAFLNESNNHGFSSRPDHETLSTHIRNSQKADGSTPTVITTSPANTIWYHGYANYSTFTDRPTTFKETSGSVVDARSGLQVIQTKQQTKEILSEGSGWIIIDYRAEHANKSVIKTLQKQSTFVKDGREGIAELRYYN